MDHLEGILFIDYLSKLKKSMIIKKLSKIKKKFRNFSNLINAKKLLLWEHQILLFQYLKNIYQNGYEISAVYTQPPKNQIEDKN